MMNSLGGVVSRLGGASFGQNCSVFNAKTYGFAACEPMPTGRSLLGAAAVGSKVYAIGGYAATGNHG